MNVLEVRNLKTHLVSKTRTVKAVDGIDLDIRPGQVVGLVGESGSGKSVAGLSIMRLLSDRAGWHHEGEILFNGQDLLKASSQTMGRVRGAGIGYVTQKALTGLDPSFRVGTQLVDVIRRHQRLSKADARDAAAKTLASVSIENPVERLSSFPHELSGGQRQRVLIGMAISCNPDLLIADEPTTALDATVQRQILDLLAQINKDRGLAVLMITHDFGVIAHICDSVGVMRNGKIVEHGTTEQVLRAPKHSYTKLLLDAVPRLGDGQRMTGVARRERRLGTSADDAVAPLSRGGRS